MEIARKVDQMKVSAWCVDVWEGPTLDHTLMSCSHTALVLFLRSPVCLLCQSFSHHPFLVLQVNFLHRGHQQVGRFTVVFIIDEIKQLKRELPLFTSPARGKHTSV